MFGTELSSFCLEHGYVLSDIDHLGTDSGSFTFGLTSGGSWGLGALGPAILWGPLQW